MKICGAWRDLARSTPEIWTSISIQTTTKFCKRQPIVLKEWLGRTAGQPLSIFVDYRTIDKKQAIIYAMQMGISKIIANCAERWYSVSFVLPIVGLEALRHVQSHVPLLTAASFLNPSHATPAVLQCPQALGHNGGGVPLELHWTSQGHHHTLYLDHTSIKRALEVIKDSPCLKQCTIVDANELADLPSAMAHTLETLKVFDFNTHIGYFFSHLTIPVLRNLALHLLGVPLAPRPGLIPLLSRCGSLISLRLSGASVTSDMLLELLQATPKLCHFVDDLVLPNGEDVHHVLSDLTRTRNPQVSNPILPSLHSLLLERVHPNRNWADFASMLCSRWKNTPGTSSSSMVQLDMVMIGVEGVSLPCEEALATFRQLSEEGMDIVLKDSIGSHDFGALSGWK